MSDKTPDKPERRQDSHHEGSPFKRNPRRTQTAQTPDASSAQPSTTPQDAQAPQAQEPAVKAAAPWAEQSSPEQPAQKASPEAASAQDSEGSADASAAQASAAQTSATDAPEADAAAEALPQSISRPDADETATPEDVRTRQLPVQERPDQGPLSAHLSKKPQDSAEADPITGDVEAAEPAQENIPQSISRPDAGDLDDPEDVRTRQLPAQAQDSRPSLADTVSAASSARQQGSADPTANAADPSAQATGQNAAPVENANSAESTGAPQDASAEQAADKPHPVYRDTMPASAIPIITADTPKVSPATGSTHAAAGKNAPADPAQTAQKRASLELKTIVAVTGIRTVLLAVCLLMYGLGGHGLFGMMLGYGGAVYMLIQLIACFVTVRSKSTKGMRILNGVSAGLGIILLVVTAIVYASWSGEDSSGGAYIFIMADIILSVTVVSARSIIEQSRDDDEADTPQHVPQ